MEQLAENKHEQITSLTHLETHVDFYDNATVVNMLSVRGRVHKLAECCSNCSHSGSKRKGEFLEVKLASAQLSSALLLFVSVLLSLWKHLLLRCRQFERIYVAFS